VRPRLHNAEGLQASSFNVMNPCACRHAGDDENGRFVAAIPSGDIIPIGGTSGDENRPSVSSLLGTRAEEDVGEADFRSTQRLGLATANLRRISAVSQNPGYGRPAPLPTVV
jgi:hypothetical protein